MKVAFAELDRHHYQRVGEVRLKNPPSYFLKSSAFGGRDSIRWLEFTLQRAGANLFEPFRLGTLMRELQHGRSGECITAR